MLSSLSKSDLGQRAGQLGLADAGRAEKNERTDGPLRIFETGAGANDGVGDGLHGFVLADDALVENLVEAKQFLLLALEQAGDRNAGPARDDFGDFVGGDFLLEQPLRRPSPAGILASASLSCFSSCGILPY